MSGQIEFLQAMPEAAQAVTKALQNSPLLKQAKHPDQLIDLLVKLGVTDPLNFLAPEKDSVLPKLSELAENELIGAKQAAEAVVDSIIAGDKIGLYSDYDCDGNTSLFIAGLTLFVAGQWDASFASKQPNKMLGRARKTAAKPIETQFTIPARTEGFGLNTKRIDAIAEAGITTMIVMDSGTVANEKIAHAIEKGIKKIIILDHHLPESNHILPSAEFKDRAEVYVINGNRRDENGKWGALSAAPLTNIFMGIFVPEIYEAKTGKSFFKSPEEEQKYRDNIDLAAMVSVIADVVSLKAPVNRYFVNRGLEVYNHYFSQVTAAKKGGVSEKIERPANWGLEYLRKFLKIREVDSESIGFRVGAALNAASRMGFPDLPAKLMFETDPRQAKKIAAQIVTLNNHRKAISEYHFERVRPVLEEFLAKNPNASAFVYYDSEMPEVPDIKGIISSRIKEEFQINAAIGVKDEEKGIIKFSVRAFEGVDFHAKVIEPIKDLQIGEHNFSSESPGGDFNATTDVISIGGHTVAAGMSINIDAFERVKTFIENSLAKPTQEARENHKVRVVDEISFKQLQDVEFAKTIEMLAPFGKDNQRPAFFLHNVRIINHRKRGQDGQHLEISIGDEKGTTVIKGGVAFFQTNSKIGEIIQRQHYTTNLDAGTRTVKLYDLVIIPFSNTHGKTTKTGFHLAQINANNRVIEEKLPEKLLPPKKENGFEAVEIRGKIKEYKHDPQKLLDDDLIQKHITKLVGHVFFDTETTGKYPGSDDPSKANAITQISGCKFIALSKEELSQDESGGRYYYLDAGSKIPVKQISGTYYAIPTFDQRLWATTPAHFAWRKNGSEKHKYETSTHEFKIDQGALDVTALEILRDGVLGPMKTYRVGGQKASPKEIAYPEDALPKFMEWVGDSQLVAYNSPFDNVGLKQQLDYLVTAAEGAKGKKALAPQLSFSDSESFLAYNKKLAKFLTTYKDSQAYQQMENPALWKCLFYTFIDIDGENPGMRLDDACRSRGIKLNRDDNAHDAMEDVGPLPILAACFIDEAFPDGIPTMTELFAYVAKKFDSRITAIPALEVIKNGKELVVNKGDIILDFPTNMNPVAQELFDFIKSFYKVAERNPHSSQTGVRNIVETAEEKRIILQGYRSAATSTIQYLSLFKKIRTFASLVNLRLPEKIDAESADYLKELNIEKIWAFATNSNVNITLKGEGNESTRTIQNIPLGAFRKSLKYLLRNPEDLRNNLELLKAVSSYKSVGIAMLTNDGILIKGHQRDFGTILIEPPTGFKPFDFGDDILHGLKFLLQTFATPGVEEATREFEAEYDESEHNINGGERVIRLKLEQNNQITATIAETTALMLAHKYKINVETGLPHSFAQGATLYRDGGSYKLSGSIGQFAEIGSDIRNSVWVIYQLQKLKNVEPSSTEIKDGKITLHLPQGINKETLYVLDRAHIEFSCTKDKVHIDLNSILVDAFHYSSEVSEENEWVKKNLNKGIEYDGSKDIDTIFDALKKESVISLFHDKNDNIYISGRRKPFIKFERNSDEPKIIADKDNQLDIQKSTVISRPIFKGRNKVDNLDLQFWLTKVNGSRTIPTVAMIENDKFIIGSDKTLPFYRDGESKIADYQKRLFELEVRLKSSEIEDLLDSLTGIAFDEDGEPIEIDCFLSDEKHEQEAGNIANRIAVLYKVYADAKAEFESFKKGGTAEEKREFKKLSSSTFTDVQKMTLILHELERHFEKHDRIEGIPNKAEFTHIIRDNIERLSRIEFLFNRIADRAEATSERIDKNDNRGNFLRKILQQISEHNPNFDFDSFYTDFQSAFAKWDNDANDYSDDKKSKASKNKKKQVEPDADAYKGYKLRSALNGTVRSLRDTCKELKQALEQCRILTQTQQELNNPKIANTLTVAAPNLIQKILDTETERVLGILKYEGYIKGFKFDEAQERYVGDFTEKFFTNQQKVADRLKELYHGAKQTQKPFILVDTSSFLSMLVAKNERDDKFGFLKILGGMAGAGYARIQITDMVLAEILNSPLPVKPADFFCGDLTETIFDKDGKEVQQLKKDWHNHISGVKQIWRTVITPNHFHDQDNPYFVPFKKADERIEWLLRITKSGLIDIIETGTGKIYEDEIRNNPELHNLFTLQAGSHFQWRDLSHADMLEQFVVNPNLISSLRKQKLRSDLGEISIHDNIIKLREDYGNGAKIFVLYQSSDVPSRIIANCGRHFRGNEASDIRQLRKQPAETNPSSPSYNAIHGANLGEGGWVTTAGLYFNVMYFLDRHNTGRALFHPEENANSVNLRQNTEEILRNAASALGGDPNRCYIKVNDVNFANVQTGNNEHLFLNRTSSRQPSLFEIMANIPESFWKSLGNAIGVEVKYSELENPKEFTMSAEKCFNELAKEEETSNIEAKKAIMQAAKAPEYDGIKALLAEVFSDEKQAQNTSFLFIAKSIKEKMIHKVISKMEMVEQELTANIAAIQKQGRSFVDLTSKRTPRLSAEALEIISMSTNIQEAAIAEITFEIDELGQNSNFINLLISNSNNKNDAPINPEVASHLLMEEITRYLNGVLQNPNLNEAIAENVKTYSKYLR